jgi:coenzyme F420-0:L-glutamate ligase/coenzyme F420-1:gamma-L-glutamate ligase
MRTASRNVSRKSDLLPSRSPCVPDQLRLFALPGLPEIYKGDDLSLKIVAAARVNQLSFQDGDVVVVAQKIVSKAQGRIVRLPDIKPSPQAKKIAATLKRDPRLIEVILRESKRIVRQSDNVLIVETHHGFVCANAGVDRSNVPGRDVVTLLPRQPDQLAKQLTTSLRSRTGKRVAVIIADTFGRPWRLGLTDFAIGADGVPVLADMRKTRDRVGKPLRATVFAVADELAAAAGLLMGKTSGTPVVVIRGYRYRFTHQSARRLIRPAEEDLFR